MLSEESELALWVVGQQQRLTDCWLFSREKQEVGGQLKELKDQLEAEQYFTVILNRTFCIFLQLRCKTTQKCVQNCNKSAHICPKSGSPSLLPSDPLQDADP